MAIIQNPALTVSQEVEPGVLGSRQVIVPRGFGYSVSATTGTIAAALAANATVFAARLDPGSPRNGFIERLVLKFTTIGAFTVPVTPGRRLEIYRGSGNSSAGGTSIPVAAPKHGSTATSEMSVANGGDIRISTTAALTVTGITYETPAIRGMTLSHVGALGGFYERTFEFHATENQPLQLEPGQLIAVRNPIAMDAGGTWQLQVDMDWNEAPALDYA